jgi:hypothetical protein
MVTLIRFTGSVFVVRVAARAALAPPALRRNAAVATTEPARAGALGGGPGYDPLDDLLGHARDIPAAKMGPHWDHASHEHP